MAANDIGLPNSNAEWGITISQGVDDPYQDPQPQTCQMTLVTTDGSGSPYSVGDLITFYTYDGATPPTRSIWKQFDVTDVRTTFRDYGSGTYTLEHNITGVGMLGRMLKNNWYLAADTTTTTTDMVNTYMAPYAGGIAWNQVDPSYTWATFRPATSTWANYTTGLTLQASTVSWNPIVTFTAGWRNLYQDLCTLARGARGFIDEDGWSLTKTVSLVIGYTTSAYAPSTTSLDSQNILPSCEATSSRSNQINTFTINMAGGTSTTRQQSESVRVYGEATGSWDTALTNVNDANATADLVLLGTSNTATHITSIEIQQTGSPNWGGVKPLNGVTLTTLPPVFGSDTSFLVHKTDWTIDQIGTRISHAVVSLKRFFGGATWQTLTGGYTWSSYGVAFPTTKWSDL